MKGRGGRKLQYIELQAAEDTISYCIWRKQRSNASPHDRATVEERSVLKYRVDILEFSISRVVIVLIRHCSRLKDDVRKGLANAKIILIIKQLSGLVRTHAGPWIHFQGNCNLAFPYSLVPRNMQSRLSSERPSSQHDAFSNCNKETLHDGKPDSQWQSTAKEAQYSYRDLSTRTARRALWSTLRMVQRNDLRFVGMMRWFWLASHSREEQPARDSMCSRTRRAMKDSMAVAGKGLKMPVQSMSVEEGRALWISLHIWWA